MPHYQYLHQLFRAAVDIPGFTSIEVYRMTHKSMPFFFFFGSQSNNKEKLVHWQETLQKDSIKIDYKSQ